MLNVDFYEIDLFSVIEVRSADSNAVILIIYGFRNELDKAREDNSRDFTFFVNDRELPQRNTVFRFLYHLMLGLEPRKTRLVKLRDEIDLFGHRSPQCRQ